MPLISSEIITLWQSKMTEMINSFGRIVTAIGEPSLIDCYNCRYDYQNNRSAGIYVSSASGVSFGRGQRCPICNGEGKIKTSNNNTFYATIQTERETIDKNNGVVKYQNVARVKTFLTNFDYLTDCIEIKIRNVSYIPLTKPVKKGLGEDFLVIGDFVEK